MRKALTAALFVTAFATLVVAQTKPNYSGTWKLNVAKSDFGPLPAPDSRIDVIDHKDPAMKINTSQKGAQGSLDATVNYTTDGKEVTNQIGPREQKSTAVWDGNKLVVNSKFNMNDAEITTKGVWTLSDDGKTLTQDVHAASPMGEVDLKFVFEKQEGGVEASAKPAATPAATATTAPATTTTAAATGPKPNFTGTWKLDVAKSDFGVMPPPNARTETIEHNDPALKVTIDEDGQEGKQNYSMSFTTDGKEASNKAGPFDFKGIVNWDGASLVENEKFKYQDSDVTMKAVWMLSDAGKTLTLNAHFESPMGEMDQKLVFAKVQ